MMKFSRIKCDLFTIMTMAILMTYSEARPLHAQQPQPVEHDDSASEEAHYNSEPLVQITKEKLIIPNALKLDNISAHTQDILAKIDQVNRQHGYTKQEKLKNNYFVPGYFTTDYNYKERVLKGFKREDICGNHTLQQERILINNEDTNQAEKIEHTKGNYEIKEQRDFNDFQQQLSVAHVKQILQTYPDYQSYPQVPRVPNYNYHLTYDPNNQQYIQFVPEIQPISSTSYINPFYSFVPEEYLQNLTPVPTLPTLPTVPTLSSAIPTLFTLPSMQPIMHNRYMQNLNVPSIYYNSYFSNFPLRRREDNCLENLRRSPKILEKLKTLSKSLKNTSDLKPSSLLNDDNYLTTETLPISTTSQVETTTSTPVATSTHSAKTHKVIIENHAVEMHTNEENRTLIKQLAERRKLNRHSLEDRRNTKRPNIFRPHTWFNNQPMHQNKSKIVNEETQVESAAGESSAISGETHATKGVLRRRPLLPHAPGHGQEQNRRKLFGKDNTGSGIFIHKLKVRRGGVAIAGPGGIATAGSGGTAIVGPNGYAFTHPDSLAIAGSGTKVIAVDPNVNLSDLVSNVNNGTLNSTLTSMGTRVGKVVATGPVIYYNKGDPKTPVKITLLPFYGGAKGQTLKIIEAVDGTVTTEIIQGDIQPIRPEESVEAQEALIESSVVPVRRESEYGLNIKNIHRSALNILRLQEAAKHTGLNEEDEAAYKEYMDFLNQSAYNLAKIYEEEDDDVDPHTRAGLSGWFARKKTTAPPKKESKDKDKKKEEENKKKQEQITDEAKKKDEETKKKQEEAKRKAEEAKKKTEETKKKAEAEAKKKAAEEGIKKKKEEEEKKQKEEKEKKKFEQQVQKDEEGPVQPPETSVAEAKPVGLAVAGIGGVASSKPVATAVVGPGGLAIARPVGTAIAGVSPDQPLVPIYAEGYIVPKPSSSKKPTHSDDYLNKIIAKYHQA